MWRKMHQTPYAWREGVKSPQTFQSQQMPRGMEDKALPKLGNCEQGNEYYYLSHQVLHWFVKQL